MRDGLAEHNTTRASGALGRSDTTKTSRAHPADEGRKIVATEDLDSWELERGVLERAERRAGGHPVEEATSRVRMGDDAVVPAVRVRHSGHGQLQPILKLDAGASRLVHQFSG